MRHILLPLFVLAALLFAGCAHHAAKSSSRIYEGDGPGIHYTERQGAGGPVGTDQYHWAGMRISKKAEYALRALVAMARRPRSWSIHELSEQERIPVKFLEQILLALRRAGVLGSKRGVGGGYVMLRAPAEISVGEVVRVLDGPLAPVPCAADRPAEKCTCPDPRTCPLRLLMTQLRTDLAAWLDGRTIDDMLRISPGADTLAFEI